MLEDKKHQTAKPEEEEKFTPTPNVTTAGASSSSPLQTPPKSHISSPVTPGDLPPVSSTPPSSSSSSAAIKHHPTTASTSSRGQYKHFQGKIFAKFVCYGLCLQQLKLNVMPLKM